MRSAPGAPALRPLAGLAAYTMFRGDIAQLIQWCNYHLTAGADALYVLLDRPSPDVVAALPSDPRVRWEVVGEEVWQALYPDDRSCGERGRIDGFLEMARIATRAGHRWLAFVDADELIRLESPIADLAERWPDAAAFTLPVREMWHDPADPITEPFGATLALTRLGPEVEEARTFASRAFGWRAQFLRDGLLGDGRGRTIYRLPLTDTDLTVRGPRRGKGHDAHPLEPTSGSVLHFDGGSLATWHAKWAPRLDDGPVPGALRRTQQLLFENELRRTPSEQESFFREFFSLDADVQERVASAGVLTRIDVADDVAGPLVTPPHLPGHVVTQLPSTAARVDFQFALACNRQFVKPTFATMTSVVSMIGHRGSIRFVVLGDGLRADDVAWLKRLEYTAFDIEVVVHDVTSDLDRDVGTEDPKRATFGQIYLVDHLHPQRTVFLDGDVLATRDFSELFSLDLGDACVAGVPDSAALRLVAEPGGVPLELRNRLMGITDGKPLDYLNGGVLVFDMDNPDFHRLALRARALVAEHGRTLTQRDQDAMNLAFAGRKHRLETSYNYMTQFYVSDLALDGNLPQLKYAAADATLVHFTGDSRPWESPAEEFYNGLYRRLVTEAEETVGVSCGFYFSRPGPSSASWSAERWAAAFGATSERPGHGTVPRDIELVDISDHGLYLRLSPAMYELAVDHDLHLSARAAGQTLFEVALKGLSPQQQHLETRVGPAVRVIPIDLEGALRDSGGVARNVEVVVTAAVEGACFSRTVCSVAILASGPAATPDLLAELGIEGAAESLVHGRLNGWFHPAEHRPHDRISLWMSGELVASRALSGGRPSPDPERPGMRSFQFSIGAQRHAGYGANGEIAVRLAGTNIPLVGTPLTAHEPGRKLWFDGERWAAPADDEVASPPVAPVGGRGAELARRVRERMRRAGR